MANDQIAPKKVAKNMLMVFFSNFATILSGVLAGFLIPKLMGIDDYGYYKTYTLYSSYIGLFEFGFADGVYTYFSGKKYEELNKGHFRIYSRFMIALSLCCSTLAILAGAFILKGPYSKILIFLGINIFATHLILYFQGIVQATFRFKELSVKNLVQSALNIVGIIILAILVWCHKISILTYTLYLCVVTLINYFTAMWYFVKHRALVFGKKEPLGDAVHISGILKVGIPVLISTFIGSLIMTIDRQFINLLFDNGTYAIYAFAYNMLALITTAVSATSTVLFPTLKTMEEDKIKDHYSFFNSFLLMFIFLALFAYFPLVLIVRYFLPAYESSLPIFRVIFPGIAMTTSITILMYNVYKTLNMTMKYFLFSLLILGLSIVANIIAYFFSKTPISISVASIVTIFIWYVLVEIPLVRHFKINALPNFLYIVLMTAAFYLITMIPYLWLEALCYVAAWLVITFVVLHKESKQAAGTVKTILKRKEK